MQVLILNGSPRKGGNTQVALGEMKKVFEENGVSYTQLDVGTKDIRGCIACGKCAKICPDIKIENNLSRISSGVDTNKYGKEVAEACPTGAIVLKTREKENTDEK